MINKRLVGFSKSISAKIVNVAASPSFLKFTYVWFGIQALFFAITVRLGLPPDETYHLEFIKLLANNHFSPLVSTQATAPVLDEVVRNPFFLYHYLLSIPYVLIRHLPASLVIMRLFSVGLGIGSLLLVAKIADEIKLPKIVKNLSIFMLANTLMFTFIFSAVSYDGLFIFLSLASVLLTLKVIKKPSAQSILLLVTTLLAGTMVKKNFLPILFILLVILVVRFYNKLPFVLQSYKKTFRNNRIANYLVCLLIVLLSVLFVQRYGVNLVRYHTFEPSCNKVRAISSCEQNALFARNQYVFRPDHPIATRNVLRYGVSWLSFMQDRTYGVFAHKSFSQNRIINLWIKIVLVFSLIAIFKNWTKKDKALTILIIICAFNVLVLFLQNHGTYKQSGLLSLALQGRYIFGVLPLIYLIANHYIFKSLTNTINRSVFILLTISIFFLSGLPTYINKASSDWYDTKDNLSQLKK